MLAAATTRHLTIIDPSIARRGPASLAPTSDLPSPPTTSTWSPDSTSLYIASANTITRYDALGERIKTVHVHTPADEPIASLLAKDKGTLIYAAGSAVHILEHSASQSATSRVVQTLAVSAGADAGPLAALSLSNDGTLLVTAAPRAVLVHNLSLGSQTVLRGLPLDEGERISACVLHAHSRIRLFLGIGRQLVVYDVTRPAGPVRLVPMSESATGEIVAIACSPYSKTLLAVACSDGHVALVDLDKEQGRIRSFNYKVPLTSLVFSPDGATLYIGTETGKLLVQTLRSMEPPKMIDLGESGDRVENLIIAKKTKASEAAAKSAASKPLAQHDVNTPRRPSIKVSISGENKSAQPDAVTSPPTKINARTRVLSGPSKPDSPPRRRVTSIVSALGKKIVSSKTPEGATAGEDDSPVKISTPAPLVRRTRTTSLRAQLAASRGADAGKDDDTSNPPSLTMTSPVARKPPSRPPSRPPASRYKSTLPSSSASTSAATIKAEEASVPVRKRTISATSKPTTSSGLTASQLSPIRTRTLSAPKSPSSLTVKSPLGSKPGSTSTLSGSPTAPARSRTTSALSRASVPDAVSHAGPSAPAPMRTRTASTLSRTTSSGSASTRTASSTSTRARTTSSTSRTSVARTCSPAPPLPRVAEGRTQVPRGGSLRTPSPELMEPSLIKEAAPFPLMDDETPQKRGKGMLGMTTPEVQRWIDAGKGKESEEKESEQGGKRVEVTPGDDEPEEFSRLEIRLKEMRDDEDGDDDEVDVKLKKKEEKLRRSLSMEMTPRRAPSSSWVPSPLRHSVAATTPGVQGAQNLLHAMIRDAMVDYRQESKAEMVGLHLDLLRMGRAWRQEMRATMEEYGRDLRELREENKRLREENERLKRGY